MKDDSSFISCLWDIYGKTYYLDYTKRNGGGVLAKSFS